MLYKWLRESFILHGPHIKILSLKHPQLLEPFICGINLKKDKETSFLREKYSTDSSMGSKCWNHSVQDKKKKNCSTLGSIISTSGSISSNSYVLHSAYMPHCVTFRIERH